MPNMGKSTLLNALLSDDLAIVTSRPQTTRHAILGVMTSEYAQLCLTDTPGIIDRPAYKLQTGMMDVVRNSVRDADAYLVVTDVYGGRKDEVECVDDGTMSTNDDDDGARDGEDDVDGRGLGIGDEMLDRLRKSGRPVIVCVNKVDLVQAGRGGDDGDVVAEANNTPAIAMRTMRRWRSALPGAFAILPTSAANGPSDPGVVALRSLLMSNDPSVDVGAAMRALGRPVPGMFANDAFPMPSADDCRRIVPVGPPLYHPDFLTDRTDRFCSSELIRETLFTSLGKELPYCCEVRVESFDESMRYVDDDDDDDAMVRRKKSGLIRMGATILVERDSQKGIVVGKGGAKIRDVGIEARKKLQEFFGVKVFLDLRVKVDKNWRNDVEKLKKYGYM
jgi:GTPase Era involved in 16S rRNA processing